MQSDKLPTLPVGAIILGKYRILKAISSGGMSNVYKCEDITLGNEWCLKEVGVGVSDEEKRQVNALISEAYVMKSLSHPNIPRIVTIEADPTRNRTYIIMDWIQGATLDKIIKDTARVPVNMAVTWADQICDVFVYLHTRDNPILYRDLKPLNIQITESKKDVSILDFGISVEIDAQNITNNNPLGTEGFAAPEMYYKGLPYDLRSDIYTIGATMFNMLTGRSPSMIAVARKSVNLYEEYKPYLHWDDENSPEKQALINKLSSVSIKVLPDVNQINPEVPKGISNIIKKAMEPLPSNRYQSVAELKADLQEYSAEIDEHRQVMKKRVWLCFLFFFSTLAFAIVALIPQMMINDKKQHQYELLIKQAEATQKKRDWLSAISCKPYIIEPYFELVEAFKKEGSFKTSDEKDLFSVMLAQDDLARSDRYGELCYNIGILYWYYYEDKDAQISSMKWFDEARKAGYEAEKSTIYYNLGKFKQDSMSFTAGQGSNIQIYKDYWDNLLTAKTYAASEENILFNLQIYTTIIDYLQTSSYNLYRSGVSEQDVYKEVSQIKATMKAIDADAQSTAKTSLLYSELMQKLDTVDDYIKNGFDSAKQGG